MAGAKSKDVCVAWVCLGGEVRGGGIEAFCTRTWRAPRAGRGGSARRNMAATRPARSMSPASLVSKIILIYRQHNSYYVELL